MTKEFGPKSLAVLNVLMKNDRPMNRLEIERALAMPDASDTISRLREKGYIASMPKAPRELVKYRITRGGMGVIGAHVQRQDSLRYQLITELPTYVPKPSQAARPGAMDAFRIPSKGL